LVIGGAFGIQTQGKHQKSRSRSRPARIIALTGDVRFCIAEFRLQITLQIATRIGVSMC
jgi:hypothetical protein